MQFAIGDRCYLLGYLELPQDAELIFTKGMMVAVAKVEPDDVLHCFPIDGWGRVYSWKGDTLFADEVVRLLLPPIPVRRFPRPYGEGDNENAKWTSRFTGPWAIRG